MDDFWGEAAWEQWSRELAKALPPPEYTIEDVPLTDPIFHSMLEVKRVPQVSGIGAPPVDRSRRSAARSLRWCTSVPSATRTAASSRS